MEPTSRVQLVTAGIFIATFDRSGRKETWIYVDANPGATTPSDDRENRMVVRTYQLAHFLKVNAPGSVYQSTDCEVEDDGDNVFCSRFSRVSGAWVFTREISRMDLLAAIAKATEAAGGKLDTDGWLA